MATTRLEIVTAERVVFSDEVDLVVAPGVQGELGILPHHAPLMTMLLPGELRVKKGGEEAYMAISGGFLEVRPDRIIILADAAERAEEIDIERAEAAKKRAEERLKHPVPEVDTSRAEASLRRAIARIQVGQRRKRRSGAPLR
jgi:F-type H+-transporting ATPase subunit epsilon